MEDYPKPVSKQCTEKILKQIDNSIFKIKDKNGQFHIGFLCYVKYKNKNIPVLITKYKIINEKYLANNHSINVLINDKIREIEFGNAKYLNNSYGLSIIEIEEKNNPMLNYIEFDDYLYENNTEVYYNKQSIYIIQNNNENDIYLSYGVVNYTNNSEFLFFCNINSISSGCPILNLSNNKLIGIYECNSKYYNKGIFLNFMIREFVEEYKYSKNEIKFNIKFNNEINILINIEKKDIQKEIYFLDNYECNHENLKELNKYNTGLYINNNEYEYKKYFIPEEEGEYNINIKFNINITDCSYMFA